MMPKLEESCRNIIIDDYLYSDTVFEIYAYSLSLGDEILYKECEEFLRYHPVAVPRAFTMLSEQDLTYEALLDMLQRNNRNIVNPWDSDKLGILVSDKDLFVACHAWAIKECKLQELEPSGPNKRRVLGDCLSLMRFPCMLRSDIVEVVLPTGILNEEEKASLLATPPENVQQMFPSTKQCFVVSFGHKMSDCIFHATQQIGKPEDTSEWHLLNNSIEFTTLRRMVLSQIWLLPRDYDRVGPHRAKYKVVIKHKDGRKTRQSIVSQVIGTEEYPVVLLLDLEPIILDEKGEYVLKVLDKGWHDDDDRWNWPKESYDSLLSKMKYEEDTYLEVTEDGFIDWIIGFTISYL